MDSIHSSLDEKQKSPLLIFCLSAAAFTGAFVLTKYLHSPWLETLRVGMAGIAAFALWTLLRFLRLADERQRRTNFRALRLAFVVNLGFSILGGFIQGFGTLHVSWIGVLSLQLIPWSFGLIYYSWWHQ